MVSAQTGRTYDRKPPTRSKRREKNACQSGPSTYGMVEGRLLFVAYTMRGETIRMISARGAEPHEQRQYHENNG
jgi:uncharacterized DUF497 family protein